MLAVDVRGIARTFEGRRDRSTVRALGGVDLSVEQGSVHGLLGPNGAGKTTLVKILSTVLLPTSGTARVLGMDVVEDVREVRRHVGVVLGGERGLYTRVTARRNMHFWGALYGLGNRTTRERTERLLDMVGLTARADQPVETFSRGMKQRLHLARGLIHEPKVLFLDEPTTGMDPVAAHEFRDLVRALQGEGRSVLITTHDMAEAEALCSRVTLIDKGEVILDGDRQDVARALGTTECVEFTCADPAVVAALREQPFVASVEPAPDAADGWQAFPHEDATASTMRWLIDRDVLSARQATPSLESVYLRVVGPRGMVL
ncbi:ABC transporter ATP-binding protein [Cellulomonas sp. P22]|uniref:ABC transporter ATP-binding protein n=1 Tax=Cellulomonas sp. P22 TaxID=3373189 RepID=UPI0037B5060D